MRSPHVRPLPAASGVLYAARSFSWKVAHLSRVSSVAAFTARAKFVSPSSPTIWPRGAASLGVSVNTSPLSLFSVLCVTRPPFLQTPPSPSTDAGLYQAALVPRSKHPVMRPAGKGTLGVVVLRSSQSHFCLFLSPLGLVIEMAPLAG